jgi:uncharacterized membrane protein YkvA (DUF1232 family)
MSIDEPGEYGERRRRYFPAATLAARAPSPYAEAVAVTTAADFRAIARFVPDCAVLFGRLLRDRRVPRRSKALLAALIPYLALPFDLVPDFIPVAGQVDDAVLVAFVLRRVVRRTGPELVRELWPGPESSLRIVLRVAGST